MKESINLKTLPSPSDRYQLDIKLGSGIFGQVYKAIDKHNNDKTVAVKIQELNEDTETHIQDEYKILNDHTKHENILDFYGIFCERLDGIKRIWFVIELCECGSVINIVRKTITRGEKLSEHHIAFILKETVKALIYLHENKVMHRNVRCSNILLTKDGEVKLADYGLSATLDGTLGKRNTSIGSPSWLAPEVITSGIHNGYDNRADVWALGITAIELADGKGPLQEMHPTRALFQIVRNPPPGLSKPSAWSNELNDFISESLEKNPEHRPFAVELIEHPFLTAIPDNSYHLNQELKKLVDDLKQVGIPKDLDIPERIIKNGLLTSEVKENETMQVEDLAALEHITEETVLAELEIKLSKKQFQCFIGDIFLVLNPNTSYDIYNESYHKKYECKSRSDNEPHIYAVADSAFQDAMHHHQTQNIVFAGESLSGKTVNFFHALNHLTYLGAMKNNTAERIVNAANIIKSAITASTIINPHSTRAVFQTQVTYGTSGKLSGAIFKVFQLEKWRIFSTDMTQGNFNLLYYFYDAMEAENKLEIYTLNKSRKYRYLRIPDEPIPGLGGCRETPTENAAAYKTIIDHLNCLDWEQEDIDTLEQILAAIILLGNVRFKEVPPNNAEIENIEEAKKVAQLLKLDESKFLWALLNYCLIENGTAVKRKHTSDEARDARDMLACNLYHRTVDWIINQINFKLSFGRAVFGDKYSVSLLDFFGFECYHRNRLEQLIVNTLNEQIQFVYIQRIFAWELQEQEEEEVPVVAMRFYDSKPALDQLIARPLGLFYIIDEATRSNRGQELIMSTIKHSSKGQFVKLSGSHEFSVAHYTGKINYDARDLADKNKDFLPPDLIETMRGSRNITIHHLFKNKLTRTGNLTIATEQPRMGFIENKTDKEQENEKVRKLNAAAKGHYSQLRRMRTAASVFRVTSLELLKQLCIGSSSGGIHFVRCIRPDLNGNPNGFQSDVVRQQIRALAVVDTAKARQKGYPCRIPFAEFIRRYKFLAFDFDENVEETKDNCRLLLIRLKMEGWILGKTKVFLKYYNVEFLARLYELQVKKIVKVQCMMRAFLVRQRTRKNKAKQEHLKKLHGGEVDKEEAAILIQKAYRGYRVRKTYGPLINKTGIIDHETAKFLRKFAMKWKCHSIFQVLLQYRGIRYQDFVHFSQQVHIYNQSIVNALIKTLTPILIDRIDPQTKAKEFLGVTMPTVWKLPFKIQDLDYYDTTNMCDPQSESNDTFAGQNDSDNENWDEPVKRRTFVTAVLKTKPICNQSIIYTPFSRDPTQPIKKLQPETNDSPTHRQSQITSDVYCRPPVYKKKQASNNAIPRAHYQPPTPWVPSTEDSFVDSKIQMNLRKTEYSKSVHNLNTDENEPSHIRELKSLARSTTNINSSDDDPPFNFQAMLRKTPRNRSSMKRSGENELSIFENASTAPTKHILGHNKGPAPTKPPILRKDSSDIIEMALKRNDSLKNNIVDEKIYLAPGIAIEGVVIDL